MDKRKIYSSWFLVPALVIYVLLFFLPVIVGFGYSFTNWNSMSSHLKFVGFKNFAEIFTPGSPYFQSLSITFIFTLATLIIKSVLGLAMAMLVNSKIRTKSLLRGIYFLPNTLAPLIIGIVFISILAPDGIVNEGLRMVGLGGIARGWLSTPETVLGSVILVESWRMIGWNMVMFLAGLQAIPSDYYEAACIDGAGAWARFRQITLPLLRPTLVITTILNIIHGLKSFDLIFALTGGGPGRLTEVLNIAVFHEFAKGRYGMSTAMGIVVFIITAVIAMLVKKVMTGEED